MSTEHSKTQFRLFANRHNTSNNKDSLLYIIVPKSSYEDLKKVLKELKLFDKDNVIVVTSGKHK